MSDLEVIRLGVNDASRLSELVVSFEGESAGAGRLAEVLADGSNIVIAAFYGGEPAGFLLAHKLMRIKDSSNKIFLYDIEVAGQHRRKGIGSALVQELLEVAKEERSRSVFVFTSHKFQGAPEFYKATGASLEDGEELLFEYVL